MTDFRSARVRKDVRDAMTASLVFKPPLLIWSECDRSVVYCVIVTAPVCVVDLHRALSSACDKNGYGIHETIECKMLARSGTVYITVSPATDRYTSHHVADTPTAAVPVTDEADVGSRDIVQSPGVVTEKRKLAAVADAFVGFVHRAYKRISREVSDIAPSGGADDEEPLVQADDLNHYRELGIVPRGVDLVSLVASRVVEYVEDDDVSAPLGIKQNVYRCPRPRGGMASTVHIDTVGPYNLTLSSMSDFQNALCALMPSGVESRLFYVPPDGLDAGLLRVEVSFTRGFDTA